MPFRHEDDPTATLPPSPGLFSRFATATLPPPVAPPPTNVQSAQVPSPPETPQAKTTVISSDSLALEATEHLNAGRFGDALTTIDRLLSTEPRNGDAQHTRAQALFKLGRREDAVRAIEKALEASPDSLAFWHYKAVMEHQEDKPKDACRSAIDLVEIAQQTDTESPLVDEGRLMITDFEATGAYPSPRGYLALLGLGCASMKAGRPEAALGFFDRAIDAASDKPDGFRWKGKALVQQDQADEALVLFDAALEVAPNDPDVHYERGMAFAILGDLERAIEAFDAALAIDPHHPAAIRERRDLSE
jgi:tetratricopeptide (TPR) repeat protein